MIAIARLIASFKQLTQFQKIKQDRPYTDHCWLEDDKLVVGTQNGELIYVDHFEQKQYIDNAYNIGSQENTKSSAALDDEAKTVQPTLH